MQCSGIVLGVLECVIFPIMERSCSSEGDEILEQVLELMACFTYLSLQVRRAGHISGSWNQKQKRAQKWSKLGTHDGETQS